MVAPPWHVGGQRQKHRGRQYGRGGRLFIGELANRHPVMVTKRQVPADELTSHALEELGNRLFAVLRLVEHALDSVGRETTTRDVDRHGISP